MPKIILENYHYSPLKKKNVGKPTEEKCEIIKLNKSTAEVYVPRIGKTLTVKRWKILDDQIDEPKINTR